MDSTPTVVDQAEGAALALPGSQVVAAPIQDHRAPEAAGGDAARPTNALTLPTVASILGQRDAEADCSCWPASKRRSQTRKPLDEFLREVWAHLETPIRTYNDTIAYIRDRQNPLSGGSQDVQLAATVIITSGGNIPMTLALAMMHVSQAPGYVLPSPVCKRSFEQHWKALNARLEMVQLVEDTFKKTLVDAESLSEMHAKFRKVSADLRAKKAMHMAVRAAAVVTLPFAPILSATLTGLDVLVFSVYLGVRKILTAEEDLRPVYTNIDILRKTLEEKIVSTQELRRDLESIRDKVESQRDDPTASRLYDILLKMENAVEIGNDVFEGKDTSSRSFREFASAMHDIMQAMGERPEGVAPLVEVDDSEWSAFDEIISELRAVPLPTLASLGINIPSS